MMRMTLSAILFPIISVVALAQPNIDRSSLSQRAVESFIRANPGVTLDPDGARIRQIYGSPFGFGVDAEAVAEEFSSSHAAMFGLRPTDLDRRSRLGDGRHTQLLGYDPQTGTYKFTLVLFSQSRDGVPVFRADLRLLVRNDSNSPLVLAESSLRDIGDFRPDVRAQFVGKEALEKAARQFEPRLTKFSDPRHVIWAGTEGIEASPTLAFEFVGNSGDPASPIGYADWLFVADAATGTILFKEDQVLNDVITGNISGMATDRLPPGADICRPENVQALPYAEVSGAGNTVFADVNGDYALTTPNSNPTTVVFRLRGSRFVVQDQTLGGTPTQAQFVTPPGPGNFQFNAANTSEFERANVNAYVEANFVRDFVLAVHPTYPTIATQTNLPVLTNIEQNCNATYNSGSSAMSFSRAGGSCTNMAFSDVIHHEFGHHVVQMGGSSQGQYGEGMSDSISLLISDQPIQGLGFQNNCNAGLRSAINAVTYPCAGEVHDCGRLLSGCIWETRNFLAASDPTNYRTILAGLVVNSVPLHITSEITPTILTDLLTLDDDDASINNGTPHCYEIIKGFGLHGMTQGALTWITYQYPSGRPVTAPQNTPVNFQVHLSGVCPAIFSNSGTIYYRIGTAGPFTSVSMTETQANQYLATLPGAPCGSVIQYYFSVARNPSGVIYDPPNPENTVYSVDVVVSNPGAGYDWVPWTQTGAQSARATKAGLGSVTVGSVNGTGVSVPFPIRFDNVPFTPVDAPSVAIGNGVLQGWTLTIDFAAVPNTNGVIVGLGNFGHGAPSFPGYRLAAFNTLGNVIPLSALQQIGSFDHTWTDSDIHFNDRLSLNTGNGNFVVTVVAGQNDNNSDIMLLSLPPGVGRLEVSTIGPTAAETINVLIATASPPPSVTDQPDGVSVCAGGGVAVLTVAATGTEPLTYRWRKGGNPLSDGLTGSGSTISGATAPSLTVSDLSAADADTYDCIITNPGGSLTTSCSAILTVFASGSGDGNGDALVDGKDISLFVTTLLLVGSPSQANCAYDMNGDGGVGIADIPLFVSTVLAA